jgi:hypothetical protein
MLLEFLALTANEARAQEVGSTEGRMVSATSFGGVFLPAADLSDGVGSVTMSYAWQCFPRSPVTGRVTHTFVSDW